MSVSKQHRPKFSLNTYRNLAILLRGSLKLLKDELIDDTSEGKKRLWTQPWLERRNEFSVQNTLVQELKLEDMESYRSFLRLDTATFEYLLGLVSPLIEKKDTVMRKAISAADRLILTLRYLATGESRASLHFSFRIGQSTVTGIIKETCSAITLVLQSYIKTPDTEDEWLKISNDFLARWNFPMCLGAIDGKHVEIRPPSKSGSHYYNYKHSFSIVLLAAVDSNMNFIYVDVGTNGRVSDGGVFGKSTLKNAIQSNALKMPVYGKLPNSDSMSPFVFVADEAFPLSTRIFKPYPQRNLTTNKRIFNYRLSRARRTVENSFGILANRYGIYQKPINTNIDNVKQIVLATCSLHNMSRKRCPRVYTPPGLVDEESVTDVCIRRGSWRDTTVSLRPMSYEGTRPTIEAMNARDALCEYFCTAGAVPWQNDMINK